jgi:hypothetical protein
MKMLNYVTIDKQESAPLTDLHAPIVRADANGGNGWQWTLYVP